MVRSSYHRDLLLLLLLLPLCWEAVFSLPILSDAPENKSRGWSEMMLPHLLVNSSLQQEAPWLGMLLDPRPFPPPNARKPHREGGSHASIYSADLDDMSWGRLGQNTQELLTSQDSKKASWSRLGQGLRGPPGNLRSGRGSSSTLSQPKLGLSKRSEGAKIPTMGLGKRSSGYVSIVGVGVLSDLRKFFNELRTNLDSVEEVAAFSQDQGLNINPQDFLALLAQHAAEEEARTGVGATHQQRPPTPPNNRKYMFGYTPNNQPYAHSGLGK